MPPLSRRRGRRTSLRAAYAAGNLSAASGGDAPAIALSILVDTINRIISHGRRGNGIGLSEPTCRTMLRGVFIAIGSMTGSTAYLAAEGYEAELAHELGAVERRHGRLLIAAGPPRPAAWAANVWHDPQEIAVVSIGEAAARLRAIQRNWAAYAPVFHRRAVLIQDRLPKVSARPLVFGTPAPAAPLGSWTLFDAGTVLAAPSCASPFAHGEARFVEDREGPPSRAYLKLWEALTLLGRRPRPGEFCVDLGGSPGGWSWALARMGAHVLSVDKAPLAPAVARLSGLEYRAESAFALDPRALGPVDWLFCDVVCYPARLLRLVERWLDAGSCRNFVCTLKFQGVTDHAAARRFAAIPGGELRHLFHNKHELTWSRIG